MTSLTTIPLMMDGDRPSTEMVAAHVLEWAKKSKPDAYAATIKVAGQEAQFRAYLGRLLELRCLADPQWMRSVTLRILDESSLVLTMRYKPDRYTFQVGGRYANPQPDWRFIELIQDRESWKKYRNMKDEFDAVIL